MMHGTCLTRRNDYQAAFYVIRLILGATVFYRLDEIHVEVTKARIGGAGKPSRCSLQFCRDAGVDGQSAD